MKNKITKYILLAFICLGLQACLFQEDDFFEKSSANRASENVAELQELLVNVPNGWKMEYYPGADYSMGGITLLCRFDGNNVTLMSEVGSVKTASGKEASSLYKVTSEESTVLTFDSFNEFIHCFSEPIMGMNTNLEGDYEFVYMGQEDNKVILQGRRYHNTMVMTPLTQGVNWKDYIGQLNLIEREAFLKTYSLMVGGQEVGNAVRTSHLFSLTVEGQTSSSVPFIYTPEGIRFKDEITIQGKTVQNFVWNKEDMTFTSSDEEAADVVLKAYYPQDYTPYEDYLGTYYMYYREYEKYNEEEDKVEFRPGYMAVELQQKVAGESFVLTSDKLETTAANIVITYDKATGKLIIKPQNVTVMGYPGALVIGFEQGFLPAHYGLDLGNLAVLTDMETGLIGISGGADENLSFSFVEYGNTFFSMMGEVATSLIFTAYGSENFSTNNYLGLLAWYDSIRLQKY
ncbi:DUF4302 domain-containing protein [Bacteroides sp. NSJ-48]|uniref:DUF4302 domain-containing protein n=1 Tax=Bacteroides sp. NSJ-48 TaxID=2763020 RepID=UPI00164C02DF|nr:DUF4302 domain-containing protein [Bacteroides sp. NSJ-48]MBC5610532.1 DUF4302 domain-containing protein [Bacteroides sp. NSJ-48]